MSATARKFATYEDLFDLPDNLVGEIIHGQLITHPRPAPQHASATSTPGMTIGTPYHRGRFVGGFMVLSRYHSGMVLNRYHLGDARHAA